MDFKTIFLLISSVLLLISGVVFLNQLLRKKKLKNWLIQWPESELKPTYIDALGHTWYEFNNPLKLPSYRGVNAEVMMNQADMCMTSKMLTEYVDAIQEDLNNGHITKAFNRFEKMKERANMVGEETTLLNLAKTFFLLEGENPQKSSSEFDKIKDEVFRKDPKARDFFLLKAFKLLRDVSQFSDEDILSYLKERKKAKPRSTQVAMTS